MIDMLIRGRIVTPTGATRAGEAQRLRKIGDGCIAIDGGTIARIGSWSRLKALDAKKVVNCSDFLVTPGLIDPHTHLVYAGTRSDEVRMKVRGMSYQEISQQGGGIMKTVRDTRKSTKEELVKIGLKRIDNALRSGVTTVEIKTGYALTFEGELMLLGVINSLRKRSPVRVVRTLLSAHAYPDDYPGTKERYIKEVVLKTVDLAASQSLADFVDVFCEPGYFDLVETRAILEYAKGKGLGIKLHADEFKRSGGAKLAAELGAASADHLGVAKAEHLERMGKKGIVAVVLPLLFHCTFSRPPAAEKFRNKSLPVAFGTDCNPNCPIDSVLTSMNHAVYSMKFTPEEALCGSTVNAAKALLLQRTGVLAEGYDADVAVFDASDEAELVSKAGVPPLVMSFRGGRVLHGDTELED
jgi:imidazolonepropionase